ncbi:hypothetical protein BJV85_002807 [Clostridium acetobutylicum]|uniref:Uncharacterized protein n=1 Tax=Clostridium acetobutylicum (strain ATCC 824 / DSM 792 / JCM 1419 / IAM 19013 / LMG 5710 / NBRC 13948 / NRRL B-527 / VKM B-1787 / 2291 / W) TaxID=272562 RepID=Q97JT2_CLOAB|nr:MULTISPECIES: hypothetical protein [Clostridium]AAK79163.1 Hypothetical protein CA_C1191 [Clostridium acetobutylicum ATCC 824]ADZ20241.1 Conserved hypothetical protein [Clostridium acetobutylicum EA 2018]AEI31698.1 hypothetical protein SMB_G1211 [Clostridium acetobutylicum DSM 1731]AWV81585.1 hypothetical protein DK921_16095 [Clostridium acetobutylicum]MBC2393225.1 hypothetical protein [Clostridium acetobutylicum]
MIKKRECLEFIDKVEKKAINSVEERYLKKIKNEKIKILKETGYMKRLKKIQKNFNLIFDEFNNLALEMNENKAVDYGTGRYYNFEYEGSHFTSEGIVRRTIENCSFHGGSVELIENEEKKEIEAVKDNYDKVRIVVKRNPNGVKAAEYLKGLGFDITSLEKDESRALTIKIDKTKLFVCGENK